MSRRRRRRADDDDDDFLLIQFHLLNQGPERSFSREDRGFLLSRLSNKEFSRQFRMTKEVFLRLDQVI